MVGDTYAAALAVAVEGARAAGEILRADFHRSGGPRRGEGPGKAIADDEAQVAIYERLTLAFPEWGFLGEEPVTPVHPAGGDPPHLWLVDPNDGTSPYLRGFRGSAVSIALLRDGLPVLGVVFAFAAPDDDGDLIAWAEGCGPITRNGWPIQRAAWPASLASDTVVFVSQSADRRPSANARCVAPGRYVALPSIAYRLALVAAGDGDGAVSLSGPVGWDYGAGHALLRGVGGDLVGLDGRSVTYTPDGASGRGDCFGGAPGVIAQLCRRPWDEVSFRHGPEYQPEPDQLDLVRLEPGRNIVDAGLLRRAQGCLLGQLAGDALGSRVEFRSAEQIRRANPNGVRQIARSEVWGTLAGQPTDDSELALVLARSIVASGGYDREAAARAYVGWYHSGPFDVGNATGQALGSPADAGLREGRAATVAGEAADQHTQANGSLMRISPLAIWGYRRPLDQLADLARADSQITHPSVVCQEACAVYTVAIAHAIATGAEAKAIYAHALAWAEANGRAPSVLEAVRHAAEEKPANYEWQQGWVLIALQNAFYQLVNAPSLEEGVVQTVMAGGDADTNGAIAGALLGAVYGREAIPAQWRQMLRSCRPITGIAGVEHPRPRRFWPVDALELAERLVVG
jgi:ADP-ribosylglycohydrolase/fructose-1,6-bisphosphatase/inositol monophosphatase family enzyme